MQKKHLISFGFLAAILVGGFLVLNEPTTKANPVPATPKSNPTCCKKQVKCTSNSPLEVNEPSTLENLSQQFISISPAF
jgi:hypothetical protein